VWIKIGCGHVLVNDREFTDYFPDSSARSHALDPFLKTNTAGLYDVMCTVKGGGAMGQAGAIRLGIARALEAYCPILKPILRQGIVNNTF
jgi:small subunit ribosomal protein S9